jgi:ribosomal-protein-alanine N-acetyltransferase
MTVSLRTTRLLLRPWRGEDIAAVGELSADPLVMEYLVPLPGWVARKRAHWEEHGFGQWVVEIPGEASFIGVVGLETVSYEADFTPGD